MSQQDDSSFFRTFMLVLGALVVFTVFIAIMANMFSPATDRSRDPLVQRELARQIAPVGQSRVEQSAVVVQPVVAESDEASTAEETADGDESGESVEAGENEGAVADEKESAPEAEDSAAGAADTQEETTEAIDALTAEIPVRVKAVVATNCAGCHRDGLQGAQRSDDAEAWKALEAQGLDTLTASVINGKGAMLPRAETTLSDDEITLAIRHMIAQATASDSVEQAAEAEEQDTDADTGEEAPSDEQSAEADESSDKDTADDAATAEESTSVSDGSESASDTTDAAATDSGEAATDVVAVAATEIPDNVKTVVDSLCAGCHISGVANAPKYGDKAAWDERMAKGMDKVLAAAIAGKNAMPARGGSSLSDAELRLAIEYMLTK